MSHIVSYESCRHEDVQCTATTAFPGMLLLSSEGLPATAAAAAGVAQGLRLLSRSLDPKEGLPLLMVGTNGVRGQLGRLHDARGAEAAAGMPGRLHGVQGQLHAGTLRIFALY